MENILLILNTVFVLSLPLLAAWLLDRWLGDPAWLPHPVVAFGKMISFCEHLLNKGSKRGLKGAFVAIVLVLAVYFAAYYLFHWIASFSPWDYFWRYRYLPFFSVWRVPHLSVKFVWYSKL